MNSLHCTLLLGTNLAGSTTSKLMERRALLKKWDLGHVRPDMNPERAALERAERCVLRIAVPAADQAGPSMDESARLTKYGARLEKLRGGADAMYQRLQRTLYKLVAVGRLSSRLQASS